MSDIYIPARLIGIDPGTEKIGICACEFTVDGLRVVDAYTIKTSMLVNRHYGEYANRYGDRAAQIKAGVDACLKYIDAWGGSMIAYESPYLGKHAQAYGSGVEIMTLMHESFRRQNQFMRFLTIDPATVKTSVSVSGKSGDKLMVRKGVLESKFLTLSDFVLQLDEHAIDSIAVALSAYRQRFKK